MPDSEEQDQDVLQVADEIARYLQSREKVADTLDGIAQWWILRQRIQEERQRVERAIHYLCKQGKVIERILPNGTTLYIGKTASESKDV